MIIQITSDKMDSNSYLLEENGHVIIIDAASGEEVLRRISEEGWQADYLFLTHEHFDHIWYLEELRQKLAIPVVACRLCSERVQDVKANLSNIADLLYYFKTGIVLEGRSEAFTCGPADVVYEDTYEMEWQGHKFEFQRLPGHSPASTIITMDEDRVFSGDYLIFGEDEITRLKDGSTEDYEAFARPVLERIPAGTEICPGHGEIYRMGDTPEQS